MSAEQGIRRVMIFREQLFKASESFIYEQAGTLVGFEPILAGRVVLGPPQWGTSNIRTVGNKMQQVAHVFARRPGALAALDDPVDIIHAHFAIDGTYAIPLAKKLDVPLVVTLHGHDVTTTRQGMLRSKKVSHISYVKNQPELFDSAAKFLCVSEYIKRAALLAGFPARKLVVHHIGTSTRQMTNLLRDSPVGPRKIIHVARLAPKKGTVILLEALAMLNDFSVILDIVGDGELRPQLVEHAHSLGLTGRVNFHGALSHQQTLDLIGAADLLVLPSRTAPDGDAEGLGMVLLEAAIRMIPIVASNHGGIPEFVTDSVTGLLAEEGSPASLSEAISRILMDRDLAQQLSIAARDRVMTDFNLEIQTAQLEDIYMHAIEDHSRRRASKRVH